jgi:hypothetical protein
MAGVSRRNSPFSPFPASFGETEILRSPYRGEEVSRGSFRRAIAAEFFSLEQSQPRGNP